MALANLGASIQDLIAIGDEQENVTDWQRRCGISKDSQIRLVKLAHMRYQHPDLDQITTFLQDFGITVAKRTEDEVWYRGYGEDQASQSPTASDIQELSDVPGSGFLVTLTDPEGFPVNLMFGKKPAEKGAIPEKLTINYEEEKPRIRKFQRFTPGPAAVHKLGHFGLCTGKFEELIHFYTTTFNIVPTDFLYVEKDGQRKNVALFAHIDRGDDYVDHHSFFMSTNARSHVHHCSFEVHDFDTQKLGHQWLTDKKYKSVWGVGRHILGSQIFDYWWDTTGNMIEHYTDGDLVNNQTPIGYGPAGDESLAIWGPEVPA
ncbi:metapyrocatechase [Aspergillus flavus]|nr:metapyrocatechase [Aspergillus flavus]